MEVTIFNCSDNNDNIKLFNFQLLYNNIDFTIRENEDKTYFYYDFYKMTDNLENDILELLKKLQL